MAEHMEAMFVELRSTREAGQKEYAHAEDNAFRNFESLSSDLELDRKKVLWVYLKKHLDGIRAHINGHVSQRESVHGRIKDAIVYLMLLDGMIAEEEGARQPVPGVYEPKVAPHDGRPAWERMEEMGGSR